MSFLCVGGTGGFRQIGEDQFWPERGREITNFIILFNVFLPHVYLKAIETL